ncbi:MAG: DUF924 domain-containing protein [Pseudomonadota bacterium]|nr:DUF924 domain-containing protein [Pseudomonadota bacterium]
MSDETHDAGSIEIEAAPVLDFWFGAPGSESFGTQRKAWFIKDQAFDSSIAEQFGPLIERALRSELDWWQGNARGGLARILLLDQFTRNVFRGEKRAFAGDAQALAGATATVGARLDEALPPFMRGFVYLPFEHAEGMAMQDQAVRLFSRLVAAAPELGDMLAYAHRHRAVIERFGRFPHRNAILGRVSTGEELAFLKEPGSRF